MALPESVTPHSQSVLSWSLRQVGLFLLLLAQILGVGIVLAIGRRQFHWGAFFRGLFTMVLGGWAVGEFVFDNEQIGLMAEPLFLWAGMLLVATISGYWVACKGRRIGFWEVYLAVILATIIFWVQLYQGWPSVLGLVSEAPSYFDSLHVLPPGIRLLGPLWDRLLYLGALVVFLMAIFGASLGFLFHSDGTGMNVSFRVEWGISKRHLSGRHGIISGTALVAILGICLGVGALVAVNGVMSGYQDDIQKKILVVQKYVIDFSEYREIGKRGLEVEGVLAQTPFTFGEAMLSAGANGIGVLLKGVEPDSAGQVTQIESNLCIWDKKSDHCLRHPVKKKRLPSLLKKKNDVAQLVVGAELFKRINQPLGTQLYLTTPVGIAGARGNAPKRMLFQLAGIFQSGMHEFDSRLAYLHIEAAQQLMGMGDTVNGVEFTVQNPGRVEVYSDNVLAAVGRYPYRTLDWRELNSGIFTALKLQKVIMFLVLTFIVIVASFNIASTLFMTVVEKSHEIAVLKSMGARDSSIMKIFILEGWVVGLLGTALGVFLGVGVCEILSHLEISIAADVYMVEFLKVKINPIEIFLVVAAALIISHLATLFPALKAARQRPVDAMRYE